MYSSPFPPLNPRVKYRTAMERAGFDVNKSEEPSADNSPNATSNNTPNASKTDLFELNNNGRSRAVSSSTTASTGLGKLMNKLKNNKGTTTNNGSKSYSSSNSPSPLSAKFKHYNNSTNTNPDTSFRSDIDVSRNNSTKNKGYGFNDLTSSIVKGDTSFINENEAQNDTSTYKNDTNKSITDLSKSGEFNTDLLEASKSNTDLSESGKTNVGANTDNDGVQKFNPNTTLEHARQKSFDMLTASLGGDTHEKDTDKDDNDEDDDDDDADNVDKVSHGRQLDTSSQLDTNSPSKAISHNIPSVVMNNSVLDQVAPLSFSSPTKSLKRVSAKDPNMEEQEQETRPENTEIANLKKDQQQNLDFNHIQAEQPCNTQTSQQLHDLLSELNKASESKALLANSIEPRSKGSAAFGASTSKLSPHLTDNVSSASTVVNDNGYINNNINTTKSTTQDNIQRALSEHMSESSGSHYSEYSANGELPVDSQNGIKFNSKSSAYLSGFPLTWGKETEMLAKALQQDEMDTKTPIDHDFDVKTGNERGTGKEFQNDTVEDVLQKDVIPDFPQKSSLSKDVFEETTEIKYPPGQGPCRKCHHEIDPVKEKAIYSKSGQDKTQDIDVLSGQWHRRCFQCTLCDLKFNKRTPCYVLHDLPYCQYHYHLTNNSICTICSGFIEGECLENDQNERYHVHCLTCYICHEIINKDYYIYNNKLTICENHDLDDLLKRGIPLEGEEKAEDSDKNPESGDDVVDRKDKSKKTENYVSKRRTRIIEF
ncbi:hypothetical protein ACO0RG_000087 [Hanseniaspora osmophila]